MAAAPQALGRRGVLTAAAWSVPAISIAQTAPAFASSGDPDDWIVDAPIAIDIQRCALVSGTTIVTSVYSGGERLLVPAGTQLRITLPTGVEFADGGSPHEISLPTASSQFTVALPDFRVTGTSGTYTVMVEILGTDVSAPITIVATPAPGSLFTMSRESTAHSVSPGYDAAESGITSAVRGATSGDQHGSNTAILLTSTSRRPAESPPGPTRSSSGTRTAPAAA